MMYLSPVALRNDHIIAQESHEPPEPQVQQGEHYECRDYPALRENFIRGDAGDIAAELEEARTDEELIAFGRKWRRKMMRL